MHHGHTKKITWSNVETGSKFAWCHQMNVWGIGASISVIMTDIWTKFGTELKHHNMSTQKMCQIHITSKSKVPAAAILNFEKNVNNVNVNWILTFAPMFVDRCVTAKRRWPRITKSRNRKLSRVSSSGAWVRRFQWRIEFGTKLKHHTIYMPECVKFT